MLRSLTKKNASGHLVMGTPYIGKLRSELPTGFEKPGLLANDVSESDPVGMRYRVRILGPWPSSGDLFVGEGGEVTFTNAASGTYTMGQAVDKWDPTTGLITTDTGTIELTEEEGLVAVSADLVITYSTLARVSADLVITYSVTAPAGTQTVSSDLVITYSTLSRVSSDLVLSWQLLGNSGMSFIPSKARTIVIGAGLKPFSAEGDFWDVSDQKKPRGRKDPNATIDITFDFRPWLADMGNAGIAGATCILSGIQDAGQYAENGKVTIFLSGGTAGQEVSITCRPTTDTTPSRTDDRTVYLTIAEQ